MKLLFSARLMKEILLLAWGCFRETALWVMMQQILLGKPLYTEAQILYVWIINKFFCNLQCFPALRLSLHCFCKKVHTYRKKKNIFFWWKKKYLAGSNINLDHTCSSIKEAKGTGEAAFLNCCYLIKNWKVTMLSSQFWWVVLILSSNQEKTDNRFSNFRKWIQKGGRKC